jgi:dihydroorotase-like cyclic amidohydrolase
MSLLRIPGMLDPHVHLRDLDWSHKATFASETAAALAGGYWAVLDMPNTPPPTINRANLNLKLERFGSAAVCDWGLYFGASQDDNQSEYANAFTDVCGLKIYNNATTGTLLVDNQSARARHYEAWPVGKRIAVHAEGETVVAILEMVRRYRRPTHFCHISTAEEMRYLWAAKAEGLPVSIGVTPHHLFLTEADVKTLGPLGLMKPELKTQADQDALWDAISDGLVDVIESDHAPHTLDEKFSDRPPYGVPGLETTLPLLCQAAREGRLSIDRIIELVAANPRRLFGLPCSDETYTLVDLEAEYEIRRGDLRTAPGWSPFEGMRVCGRVLEVRIRGRRVFDGENVLVEPGFGENVARIQQAVT